MSKTVVLYRSKYGTTKAYAERIARKLGAELADQRKYSASALDGYDAVVFGGGIYAGGIAGSGWMRRRIKRLGDKPVAVFSVGLTPTDRTDIQQKDWKRSFRGVPEGRIGFFHFPGRLEMDRLTRMHRFMMGMRNRMAHTKAVQTTGTPVLELTQPLVDYIRARLHGARTAGDPSVSP